VIFNQNLIFVDKQNVYKQSDLKNASLPHFCNLERSNIKPTWRIK